jgi:DNA-binding CsgD family transcriptional regulator
VRPRGITADRVVELCDGTRDAQQIADVMGVGIAYVRATVRRRKVGHLLVVRPPNPGLKVQLRAAEVEIARLTAERTGLQQRAYVQGLKNGAETLRSMDATAGVLHKPTLDLAATCLEDIAARGQMLAAGLPPPPRARAARIMTGREPFTSADLEARIDAICGCNGRWDCDCVSVFSQALGQLWFEHNSKLSEGAK